MKYLRNTIAFLFVLCFFSVYSQTRLTKGVSHFPSYQAVVTQFYTHYRPKGDPDPNAMLQFARQPDGWYIITNTIQDQNTKTTTPFWQPATGFLNLNGIFSILDSEKDVLFPHYQSEAYVRDNHTIRMFNLHTFYGYQGWADDIVMHLRPDQLELNDEDLYSLGRAHSARASSMMHHNPDGSNLPKVEYKHSGNSMTGQQLTDYYRENLAARECFKIIANRNPVFYDIVGKIQTKYANEVMQAYLDLLIFQNEELGKRQLIPNIYPPELVAHARNYLNNLPKGALFISFGDNDTYPLWYVQVMENLRTDVVVVNYSLLGLPQYISALRRGMNGNKINLGINQSTYEVLEVVDRNNEQNELNEQSFIAWMNEAKNISYQCKDFPGLFLTCPNNQKQMISKERLFKIDVALLDLYISNKDRVFCGSYSAEPLDIFGKNWLRLGLVEELNLCEQKKINYDSLLLYYSFLDQNIYHESKNFPYKPGTAEYIDEVVISKLYQNLLQHMFDCKSEGRKMELEKFKLIWNQWANTWAVKPNEHLTQYYNEYINPKEEIKAGKGKRKK